MRLLPVVVAVALGVMIGALGVRWILPAPALPDVTAAPVAAVNDAAPEGELSDGERATIDLFRRAQGSVVFITTTMRGMDMFNQDAEVPRGTGSGFVWGTDGHVVTNAHVVRGAVGATVRLPGGRAVSARLVGVDDRHDLAVLQVPGMGQMQPLPLGRSADMQVGQSVYAIGNPFGLDFTLTTGIVSALEREIPVRPDLKIRGVIQTDAAINPGNSGGPLLDSQGRVIGVNTAIFSPSGASAGIGFAVPVDTVKRVVPQLIERGRYAPPALGITGDPRADALLRSNGQPPGVIVLDVIEGGPAALAGLEPAQVTRAGLVPGDVIEAIDGASVDRLDELLAELDTKMAGDTVVLTLRNGRTRRDVEIVLAPGA